MVKYRGYQYVNISVHHQTPVLSLQPVHEFYVDAVLYFDLIEIICHDKLTEGVIILRVSNVI